MIVGYVRELSQRNEFPVNISKSFLSATFAPKPRCSRELSEKKFAPSNAQEIYVQEICPWNFSSGNMSKRPLFKKYARIAMYKKNVQNHSARGTCRLTNVQCTMPTANGNGVCA